MDLVSSGWVTTSGKDRVLHDLYETPPSFVRALLKEERFDEMIWEPAAGKGKIAKVLKDNGHTVRSTDLIAYEGGGEENLLLDFLSPEADRYKGGYDIITNPPYSLLAPFVEQAMGLCKQKVAMVMPIMAMGSVFRYERIWNKLPLKKIIVSSKGHVVTCGDGRTIKSSFLHMWAVFDRDWVRPAEIVWTDCVTFDGRLP